MSAPDAARAFEPAKRLPMKLHIERDVLVVWRHRGASGRLVLSLSRIAHPVPRKLKNLGPLNGAVRAAMNDRGRKVRLSPEPLDAHCRSCDQPPALSPSAGLVQ